MASPLLGLVVGVGCGRGSGVAPSADRTTLVDTSRAEDSKVTQPGRAGLGASGANGGFGGGGGAVSPGALEEGASPTAAGWIDRTLYRLRLESVRRCGAPAEAGREARIGALVRVESRAASFSVTPGDFALESGGIIVRAQVGSARATAGCDPLLAAKRLKAGQVARGLVELSVPESLRKRGAPLALVYRPTRWGGAEPIRVELPACFGVEGVCLD